jgi:hypothetical protein
VALGGIITTPVTGGTVGFAGVTAASAEPTNCHTGMGTTAVRAWAICHNGTGQHRASMQWFG